MTLTAAQMQVKVDKLTTNMDRLNNIVNGTNTQTVSVDSGTVPSIAKLLRDQQLYSTAQLDALFNETSTTVNSYLLQILNARSDTYNARSDTYAARDLTLSYRNSSQTYMNNALDAKNQALQAAGGSGISKFYDTKAAATADLANIATNGVVCVWVDESINNHQTIYRKEGGVLVFKINVTLQNKDALTSLYGVSMDAFATPEDAISYAAANGVALRATPGKTYTFNTGITITDQPLVAHFRGAKFVRGTGVANSQPAIRINHSFSAATYGAADNVSAMSYVSYDYGNGATFVPRLTLPSVAGYAVGQIVKVMSADRIPAIAPWADYRYAEMMEIGAVDVANNYIYFLRPFAETWTPTKICRASNYPVIIEGGEFTDAAGYPVARNAPMILLRGAVRPTCTGMQFRDTASIQLQFLSCYEGVTVGNRYDRPRHAPDYSAYAYGEFLLCSTRPRQSLATGSGCRHVFDTGSSTISDANLATSEPAIFGGTTEGVCYGGVGMDSLNAPFNDHPDAFRTRFIGCVSRYTNRRSPDATLWGIQLRGRGSSVEGGEFEAITPVHVEPSTSIPNILFGFTAIKTTFNDTDCAKGSMVEIEGGGVIGGGKANVTLRPAFMHQKNSRKEMIDANNAKVIFDGNIKYDFSLSNAVLFRATNSEIVIHRLFADFSDATSFSPILCLLNDAASEVKGIGLVHVIDAPHASSGVVLTDFNNLGGKARWMNVIHEGANALFSNNSGWRNAASATIKWSRFHRMANDRSPADITVNFSSGSGPKDITSSVWAEGRGELVIYIEVNPTTTGTYVGNIPAGQFVGQRLVLNNIAASFSFAVQTYGNISVAASRTVAAGTSITLRWNGTNWVC